MALNGLVCADVPLRKYSLTLDKAAFFCHSNDFGILCVPSMHFHAVVQKVCAVPFINTGAGLSDVVT